MDSKVTQWRPGPTVCRCCLMEGCYKDISTEYFWMGKREVYAEMLLETLDLNIAYSQTGGPNSNSRLICEPCIARLRDASEFKKQVQECEKSFMQYHEPVTESVDDVEVPLVGSPVKLEELKSEKAASDDGFDDRMGFGGPEDDDDLDDQPLTKLASRTPKKEDFDLTDLLDNAKVAEKRKSTSKVKASPAKRAKKKDASEPSASNNAVEKKKKKKGYRKKESKVTAGYVKEKENAEIILDCSTAMPFRWSRGKFICGYCPLTFITMSELKYHTTNHCSNSAPIWCKRSKDECLKIEITNLQCRLCHAKMAGLEPLKTHLRTIHAKQFHMDTDYGEALIPYLIKDDEFKCVVCSSYLTSCMNLIKHMSFHYQRHICAHCGRGFARKHQLNTHMNLHDIGEFPCLKCDKVFKTRGLRYRHVTEVHGPNLRHKCQYCNEMFPSYESRSRHLINMHNVKNEFPCTLCPAVFTLVKYRNYHIRHVHVRDKKHKCTQCTAAFVNKSCLSRHMTKHTGERNFQCTICNKTYTRRCTLTTHMRSHDQNKRLFCSVCSRSFSQKHNLVHHISRHHPEIPPWSM